MTSYPLPTLAPTVDATGISVVAYSDILLSLQASMQNIFGSDIYIGPDSQDGQLLGIFALAISDAGQAMGSVFQSFSPTYSQGAQLSSLVKINGLTRNISSLSTCVGTVTGVVESVIINGIVKDSDGDLWDLPSSVTIPSGGTISVTITSQKPGYDSASIGSISTIVNPQLGWQSFSNTTVANSGVPVEPDSSLKNRQSISTSLPAVTVLDGILASVANIVSVTRYSGYDNSTPTTDSNGVPGHALAMVVQGGAAADIGTAIALKLMPGAVTYGSANYVYYDQNGQPTTINWSTLISDNIYISATIRAIPNSGYVSTTLTAVQTALVNFINSLPIGETVYYEQCVAIAALVGTPLFGTFRVINLYINNIPISGTPISDIPILFNHAAASVAANVSVVLG